LFGTLLENLAALEKTATEAQDASVRCLVKAGELFLHEGIQAESTQLNISVESVEDLVREAVDMCRSAAGLVDVRIVVRAFLPPVYRALNPTMGSRRGMRKEPRTLTVI
jgi:hypothetical protein